MTSRPTSTQRILSAIAALANCITAGSKSRDPYQHPRIAHCSICSRFHLSPLEFSTCANPSPLLIPNQLTRLFRHPRRVCECRSMGSDRRLVWSRSSIDWSRRLFRHWVWIARISREVGRGTRQARERDQYTLVGVAVCDVLPCWKRSRSFVFLCSHFKHEISSGTTLWTR